MPPSPPPRPLRRVLVPTDFSAGAAAALDRVAFLPIDPNGVITLLHVLPKGLRPPLRRQEESEARRRLALEAAGLAKAIRGGVRRTVRVATAVSAGDPVAEIVRRGRRAELTVLGRHGHRRFRDLMLGTIAERVFRHGATPVLIVARAARHPYRVPVVAVDTSPAALGVLDAAVRLAGPTSRVLHVVHTYERIHDQMLRGVASEPSLALYDRQCRDDAKRDLDAILQASAAAGGSLQVLLSNRDTRSVVLGVARKLGADVIILGTQARTGLSHLLDGSVAEGIARHAECDVLVVPPARARPRRRG